MSPSGGPANGVQKSMIRIGLYSEDRTLQPILSSALGRDFQILLESNENGVNQLIAAGDCDVIILDLNSNHGSLQERIECSRRIIASPVASVVMADDSLRATAVDLVRQGAYGYCRRPRSCWHRCCRSGCSSFPPWS